MPHYYRTLYLYRVERPTMRVTGDASEWWFVLCAAAFMLIMTGATGGISFLLLPLTIATLRNRPLVGVAIWSIAFGWTGIGWIVALVKACGNR